MAKVRVLVLRAAGINCDEETAFAWSLAGADPECIHVNRLIESTKILDGFQVVTIPGGFSYGDDIASGRILGRQIVHHAGEAVGAFVDRGGLVCGICNGFQVLVQAGLLPGRDCQVPVTLTLNDSARYEDRWVHVQAESDHCAFLKKGDLYQFPVAHGEGKFAVADETALAALKTRDRIALRYVNPDGSEASYPANPNGSIGSVAGLTDSTGRIFGLMPHPERNLVPTNHPAWTRDGSVESEGPRVFRRAVEYFS